MTLYKVISKRFPEHLAEFVISVHTGMRLSEQYSCTWSQVHLDRRTIDLTKTKNGSARTVHLNSDAVAALNHLDAQSKSLLIRSFLVKEAGPLRHTLMVCSLLGRSRYRRLRMALQPPHVLLLAGNGGGEDQGNPGSGGAQDDHDVGAI